VGRKIRRRKRSYRQFIEGKITVAERAGFEVDPAELHPSTMPHQRDAILWAARLGRALIAMSFGLGKTHIQIELARLIHERTGKRFLVVCPLGVKHQFAEEDGPRLGVRWLYVRTDAEIQAATSPYLITNYERVRDGDITPARHDLAGVSLDEGSVLRSLGSKTYQTFNVAFAGVPFRFIATATPAPNRYKELIHYAEFLNIMDRGQALTRWFKRDTAKAGNLTIHPHHERDFWLWVASWALFLYTPSDLGYSDEGYNLPELRVHWHRIDVDQRRAWSQTDNRGQHRLFLDAAAGVGEACAEKRATLADRVLKMAEILEANPGRHWLLWHHLEDERRAIEAAVPGAVSVYGSQDLETREERIIGFTRGEFPILATKPEIAGSGCNFQRHCHSNVFLGVDYKFQDFIQAIHRTHRFQQANPVDVHIIYAESEDAVVDTLRAKWEQHDELVAKMRAIIRRYGLAHAAIRQDLARTMGVDRQEYAGKLFTAVNNDCTLEMCQLEDNSVGLICTSIPFGNHYEYSESYEDFGHNPSDADFWRQMDYVLPCLYRVLKPGRVAAVHVKDRILYGHQTKSGIMEVSEFSDDCVKAFRKHGFLYQGRRTIVTDVVRENASTYRLGYTEMTKDASKMGSGLPEYLLLFRKPPTSTTTARADEPVTKAKALETYHCPVCSHAGSPDSFVFAFERPGPDYPLKSYDAPGIPFYHCPACGEAVDPLVTYDGYSRARWQIDAHSFWRSSGNRLLLPGEVYDYEAHVARLEEKERNDNLPASWFYEPPESHHPDVWTDIVFMRTLNSDQTRGKRENHLCPLPFDIVERAIRLYSNEGDLVLDPFAGLFTVPYVAVKMRRRAYGIELNATYYADGVRYCQAAEVQALAPTLFDWLAVQQAETQPEEVTDDIHA
jgi:DNA modification methylase